MLIDLGVNVDAINLDHNSPLAAAAMNCSLDMCRLLIDAGAQVSRPNKEGQSPLHMACLFERRRDSQIPTTRTLIKSGANLYTQANQYQWTPLHIVCGNNHCIEMIKAILEAAGPARSADVKRLLEMPDGRGQTAVFRAVYERLPHVVQLLYDWGANVHVIGEDGCNLLHVCCVGEQEPDLDLAKLLISLGVDVNQRGKDGMTPLLRATLRRRKDIVSLLLEKGALPE